MPDDTTILSLPLILPAQAQKHVTHNEALVQLDLIVQLAVINRTLTTAPALPSIGDRHIVAAGATGAWVGQSGRIALFTEAGWQFTQPLPGWQAHVLSEGQTAVFDGLAWKTPADGPLSVTRLGVSTTADATNRLAVASPATLFTHAGGGHQMKLNKATTGDTASLLFQTGFGGRAEMGTAGSDDFSVKLSADGATWFTALEADAATGEVTLSQPLHLGGQAADPASPADGTLWLNTTSGEVKVRSGGLTLPLGGGGGVSDGDKGDITVSGAGASWTIDPGAVTLAKLADIATDSFLGRDTAGTGAPEVLTPAQARTILNVADGATANATDAALRDRSTHTGTQAAATITGLAAVATSGSASDLGTGTLPAARFNDTAHGTRAGGALHAAATTSVNGFMSAADKTKLDAITGTNTGDQTITLTGEVTGSGTGSFAATIAANVVTNAKLADMGSGQFKGRATAGTGDPEDLTATQATALLDVFSAGAKGLAPASGGGTTNFLRADGTWAAPGGGGGGSGDVVGPASATDNALARFDSTTGKLIQDSGVLLSDTGTFTLPDVASPATPAAGSVNLFGTDILGRMDASVMRADGRLHALQEDLGHFTISRFQPAPGLNTLVGENSLNIAAGGTVTAAAPTVTNLHTMLPRIEVLVTTAATTAIARLGPSGSASRLCRVGRDANAPGGFLAQFLWGPATGVATTTNRAFCGLDGDTNAPTDIENSTKTTGIVGMGWDAADANIQLMHNDLAGVATKIDLGASFPVPTTDRTQVYELTLYSPNETTQSVYYRVVRYNTTLKTVAAEATGTITTNLPPVTTMLAPHIRMSVGGTSSVIGIACMGIAIKREY